MALISRWMSLTAVALLDRARAGRAPKQSRDRQQAVTEQSRDRQEAVAGGRGAKGRRNRSLTVAALITGGVFLLGLVLLLGGCAGAPARKNQATFIKTLRRLNRDGTSTVVAAKEYSPFEHLIGTRVMLGGKAQVDELFAFEADVPNGAGDEGAYIALLHSGSSAELRYFEQSDHRPRADRYFHRPLSSAEWARFTEFLRKNPMSALRGASASATTAPASDQATGSVDGAVEDGAMAGGGGGGVVFRITDARANGGLTLEFPAPGPEEHPRIELVKMIADLRDAGERSDPGATGAGVLPQGLVCTYVQALPPTATLIYADPFRSVERVWASGSDVRAVISPRAPAAGARDEAGDGWLALRKNQWVKSSEPPPSEPVAPAAATQPQATATAPAPSPASLSGAHAVIPLEVSSSPAPEVSAGLSAAAPATQPSPFSNPDMLSEEESWSAQPRGTFTAVSHYLPMNAVQSEAVEFWVPTLQFDDQHMWVDAAHGLMYVIHDGALFSLPIPPAALMRR